MAPEKTLQKNSSKDAVKILSLIAMFFSIIAMICAVITMALLRVHGDSSDYIDWGIVAAVAGLMVTVAGAVIAGGIAVIMGIIMMIVILVKDHREILIFPIISIILGAGACVLTLIGMGYI